MTQDVVVTPERSIVVRTLRDGADLPSATRHLRGAGFVTEPGSARARFSACVGAPYCRRTDVSTLDRSVVPEIEEVPPGDGGEPLYLRPR